MCFFNPDFDPDSRLFFGFVPGPILRNFGEFRFLPGENTRFIYFKTCLNWKEPFFGNFQSFFLFISVKTNSGKKIKIFFPQKFRRPFQLYRKLFLLRIFRFASFFNFFIPEFVFIKIVKKNSFKNFRKNRKTLIVLN